MVSDALCLGGVAVILWMARLRVDVSSRCGSLKSQGRKRFSERLVRPNPGKHPKRPRLTVPVGLVILPASGWHTGWIVLWNHFC